MGAVVASARPLAARLGAGLLHRAMRFGAVRRAVRAAGLAARFDRPAAFVAREVLTPDNQPRAWRLRDGRGDAVLRSGSRDVDIFEEIFRTGIYVPPDEVAAALARDGGVRRVVDLGGNVGLFALFVLRTFADAHVVSYEPDPDNLVLLRACRTASADRERWEIREVAGGTQDGVLPFVSGEQAESRRPVVSEWGRDDLISVPLVDVLPELAAADFVKIDIEGGEWPILQDPRFRQMGARAVVLEYHGQYKPEPDARAAAHRLLSEAGYATRQAHESPAVEVGLIWAWRP